MPWLNTRSARSAENTPAGARRPGLRTGFGVLGLLAVLGVLLAFHQVMLRAVEQGELRRRATAAHWQATWRCNALHDRRQQQACQAQLRVAPPDGEVPTHPAAVAAATGAQ